MLRKLIPAIFALALGVLVTTPEASARGRKGKSCRGSSCGSCCTPCPPCCMPACHTCPGGVCDVAPGGMHHASAAMPATIVVSLPAGARLTIDGQATTSTSATRTFRSPALEEGQYSYTLRAEFERDGKTETVSQLVVIRPGRETRVSLDAPTGVAAR